MMMEDYWRHKAHDKEYWASLSREETEGREAAEREYDERARREERQHRQEVEMGTDDGGMV